METINQEKYHHWKEEETITSPDKIADTFADHYANISRDLHKKTKPGKNRKRKKKKSHHIINHS